MIVESFLLGLLELFDKIKKKALQNEANALFDSLNPKTIDDLEIIDSMDGLEFEHFVAHILEKNDYLNVKVTSGSNDFGVDITANKGADHYAIQVKRQESKVSRRE